MVDGLLEIQGGDRFPGHARGEDEPANLGVLGA
jgi:hypothetical protein